MAPYIINEKGGTDYATEATVIPIWKTLQMGRLQTGHFDASEFGWNSFLTLQINVILS
jgi:hypothetical protein